MCLNVENMNMLFCNRNLRWKSVLFLLTDSELVVDRRNGTESGFRDFPYPYELTSSSVYVLTLANACNGGRRTFSMCKHAYATRSDLSYFKRSK